MSKLSSAFKFSDSLRTKTFEIKGNKFTVKVPLSQEKLAIDTSITDITEDEVNARFLEMTEPFKDTEIEGIEKKDDDIIVFGSSAKETARAILQLEKKITLYFKFLVPDEGESNDFTYEDIDAELPLQLQLEIVEKITEAIEPNYKEARKN